MNIEQATNNGESRLDPLTREIVFGGLEDVALSSAVFDNVRVWFNNKVRMSGDKTAYL